MRCYPTADVHEFAAAALPWLAREPFRNNVVATVIGGYARATAPRVDNPLWLTVADASGPVGVAVMTPPRGLLLSAMPVDAIPVIVDWLVAEGIRPPSIDAAVELAETFQRTYGSRVRVAATNSIGTRMFRLDRLDWPAPTDGSPRPATIDDRDLLISWSDLFSRDAHPEQHERPDPAAPVDQRLRSPYPGLMWLWEVDGVAVSMAWLSDPVAGVSRISGVYTPSEQRGHGYASAVVAHASQHALDCGSTDCMLFTDRANPTSNKIYQAIGYRAIGDYQQLIFKPR